MEKVKYSEIKQNKLEVKNFDRCIGYAGRCRKPMIDWVTQYIYTSNKSLTLDEFKKVLEGHEVCGAIKYMKRKLSFANGRVLYKHICEAVMC